MSSFFGQDEQKPQQAAAPGTTPPAAGGSAAPPTAQQAPKPAPWTNIGTFLGAQTQGARNSITAGATNAANQAAATTNQASADVAAKQGAAINAGVNTGSVSVTPDAGGFQHLDDSKQNLTGYTGPGRSDIAGAVNPQLMQAANAAPHATVSQNPYDNAVARTSGGWGQLRQAVGSQNQAAQNAAATVGSLQEQAAGAAQRSNQNVEAQKAARAGWAANNTTVGAHNAAAAAARKAASDAEVDRGRANQRKQDEASAKAAHEAAKKNNKNSSWW